MECDGTKFYEKCCGMLHYEWDAVLLWRLFDKVLSSDVVEALEVNNVF